MSVFLPTIEFFFKLADAAAIETLSRFRCTSVIENKLKPGFSFDPVTDADREAEKAMRTLIELEFPGHSILGEEFGLSGTGPIQWVLDPIDGTRPFLCGLPVWGTLIGLKLEGRAVMGMMSQPFTRETFWSDGNCSWVKGPSGTNKIKVRDVGMLSKATLHTTAPEPFQGRAKLLFEQLSGSVKFTRYGGECYAFAMLAAGHMDLCVELAMQPYDIVALIPIVEGAGGVVSGFDGGRVEEGGNVLASATPELHEAALRILNS